MACTGCAQRRAALIDSARAIGRANFAEARDHLSTVGRSLIDDAQRLAGQRLQAAKDRLSRR